MLVSDRRRKLEKSILETIFNLSKTELKLKFDIVVFLKQFLFERIKNKKCCKWLKI